MKQNKIYLLFTNTRTLFTRTIRLYTKADYNHASIALDPNFNETYSFGRKKSLATPSMVDLSKKK